MLRSTPPPQPQPGPLPVRPTNEQEHCAKRTYESYRHHRDQLTSRFCYVRGGRGANIPALASVGLVTEASSTGLSTKKALMTRERLRAGLHDPRGLLNLVGSSTDALERTKKWELMKSAG